MIGFGCGRSGAAALGLGDILVIDRALAEVRAFYRGGYERESRAFRGTHWGDVGYLLR